VCSWFLVLAHGSPRVRFITDGQTGDGLETMRLVLERPSDDRDILVAEALLHHLLPLVSK
jgi:hypothetical protein